MAMALCQYLQLACLAAACTYSSFAAVELQSFNDAPQAKPKPAEPELDWSKLHPTLRSHAADLMAKTPFSKEKREISFPLQDEMEALATPKFSPDSADLVLAMGYGLQEEMSRFVRSWLPFAPAVRMTLLLLNEDDMEKNKYLQGWGVELRHVPWESGRPELERYSMFESYLEEPAQAGVEYLLISDIRDVLAQGNPFPAARALWPGKLLFTTEDPRLSIGSCPFNSRWVKHVFEPSVLARLADLPVSCSGVTLGDVTPLRRYLRSMMTLANATREAKAAIGAPVWQGADQGLHNCLVHDVCKMDELDGCGPKTDDVVLLPHGVLAFNMAWVPDSEVVVDHFGRVRLAGGSFPALLHQFDRNARVTALLQRMYPVVHQGYFPEELRLLQWLIDQEASSSAGTSPTQAG